MNSSGREPATLRACSACAGDYEDPELTTWAEEFLERDDKDDDKDGEAPARDDFPVRSE